MVLSLNFTQQLPEFCIGLNVAMCTLVETH